MQKGSNHLVEEKKRQCLKGSPLMFTPLVRGTKESSYGDELQKQRGTPIIGEEGSGGGGGEEEVVPKERLVPLVVEVLESALGGDGEEEMRIGYGVLLGLSLNNLEQQGFFGGLMVILGLLETLVFFKEEDDLVDTIIEERRDIEDEEMRRV
ncbi:hypothetical protein Tco_1018319 [Tanacetum coccineum]|uniref:Uncharacterized protein n=1 Tax=Tanacetum coccineum TaxID=301880 RepID=A0ABQ5FUH8_9ASTR